MENKTRHTRHELLGQIRADLAHVNTSITSSLVALAERGEKLSDLEDKSAMLLQSSIDMNATAVAATRGHCWWWGQAVGRCIELLGEVFCVRGRSRRLLPGQGL